MSKKCTIVIDDEVNCRIGGLHPGHLEVLWNKFGFYVEGYRYMPQFQLGRWSGKVHFMDQQGKTYTKLLVEILPYLVVWEYDIDFDDRRLPVKAITEVATEDMFQTEFKFRPYQLNVINKLLQEGSGFGICATGSGKTSMCAAMAYLLAKQGFQVIIIVPSGDLITQTVTEFEERLVNIKGDLTIGSYSGSEKNIDHPIVVATWQSLQNAPHYMAYFQAVIVDEAHGAKADVIKKLINEHGKHIAYRYGVTGTFPKPETDQYSLRTSIGPIHVTVDAAWLISQGYLSSINITDIEIQDLVEEEFPDYQSERAYLSKNTDRLELIAKLIMQKRDEVGNTLVLVNSIVQGQALEELIPGAVFLFGESENDLRKQNYQEYAERDNIILIASVGIASTGISIDRIFCQWLIDTGKSFVKCIQSVGRGLRKKGDKKHIEVYDVHSKLKFSKKHFKKRKEYYQEAGYPISKPVKVKYTEASKPGLLS
jgi:superfamily II DNA or RNA helicase